MKREFLDYLDPPDRARLENLGVCQGYPEGQLVLKRGEETRDIYKIERGTAQVTDTRCHPPIILKTLGRGEVLGELGFVCRMPRSADVFAGPNCEVRCWPAAALDRLIEQDPGFASRFWKAIATEVTQRLLMSNTVGLGNANRGNAAADPLGDGDATNFAREIARSCRDELARLDGHLRRAPEDEAAHGRVQALLSDLGNRVERLAAESPSHESLSASAQLVSRELLPYLRQAKTARLCLERREGVGGADVLAHLVAQIPEGDSPLGRAIDRWLLGLPFARGIRSRQQALLEELRRSLPPVGPVRVMIVHSGGGSFARHAHALLQRRAGVLIFIERSRDALERLARETAVPDSPLRVQFLLDNLADLPPGASLRNYSDQHVVAVDSLVEYLPTRVCTESLAQIARTLGPRGQLLVASLVVSEDASFWEHLLEWPTIRRSPRAQSDILHAAGFGTVSFSLCSGAGALVVAREPRTVAPT
jgi:CRP-like cAMP-binding protein/SAM-dependent methyltransferase